MRTRFTVTISRSREVRATKPREWKEGAGADGKFGYTPEVETVTTETDDVYTQVCEDLDVAAVIKAVNKAAGQ